MLLSAQLLSCVRLFVILWTVAHPAPLSIGFPRQEYWRGLPFPSPGDISDPRIEPVSPALAGRFFTPEPSRTSHQIRLHLYDLLLTSYICDDPVSK